MEPDPAPSLPKSVTRLDLEGREIYLVGTAHVSKQSVEDVREAIEMIEPDTVCVELCASRYQTLTDPHAWRKLNIFRVLREGKAALLLSSLLMSSFQRRIAEELGVTPGAEMLEGIRRAEAAGHELVLADRDIQTTLKRAWSRFGFWAKLRLIPQLVASLVLPQDIDEETIESMKEKENLGDVLEALAQEMPRAKDALIDERDTYLAQKIRDSGGQRVVAVVGAAHVPGISREIEKVTPLGPLDELPPPARWPKVLQWLIPAVIVGLVAYGFSQGGSQHSMESIYLWVLINGSLSALGTALALGHPLTILSAFVAAPLTSLNPTIAAGWVAGLVQAWIKSPTVQDLEDLPKDISTLAGFWRNAVSRILLVVVLANLGSTVGTLVAGSWIAARTL